MATGLLDVTVVSATLIRHEGPEPHDTYVKVKCGYEQFLTQFVTEPSSSPVWNKTSTLKLQGENMDTSIIVEVSGRKQQSNELLGLVRIPLSKALSTTGTSVYPLIRPDLGECGHIKIAFYWESQVLDNQGNFRPSSTYSTAPSAPSLPGSGSYDLFSNTNPDISAPINKNDVDSATAAFSGLGITSDVQGQHIPKQASNDTGTYPYQRSGCLPYSDPSAKYYGGRSTDEDKQYTAPMGVSAPDYHPQQSLYSAESVIPHPTNSSYPPPPYPPVSNTPADSAVNYSPPPPSYPPQAATNVESGPPYSRGDAIHPGYPPRELQRPRPAGTNIPSNSPGDATYPVYPPRDFQPPPPAPTSLNSGSPYSPGDAANLGYPPKKFQHSTQGGNREDSNVATPPYPPTVSQSSYHRVDSKSSSYGYAYPPPPKENATPPVNYSPPSFGQVGSPNDVRDRIEEGLNALTQDKGKNSPYGQPSAGYPPPPTAYPQGYSPAGYPPAGYPPAGYPPHSAGYPPSGYAPYPPSGYPPAQYPHPGYAHQYPSYTPVPYPSPHSYQGAHSSHGAYGGYAVHGHGQHHGHHGKHHKDFHGHGHHGHGHHGHGHHGHGHHKHHKHHY